MPKRWRRNIPSLDALRYEIAYDVDSLSGVSSTSMLFSMIDTN
jgi:hypothetical protein